MSTFVMTEINFCFKIKWNIICRSNNEITIRLAHNLAMIIVINYLLHVLLLHAIIIDE